MDVETRHFPDADQAIPFLTQSGFRFLEAPGRWWKGESGRYIRAELHITAHGALVVISG
ncbi:hypothetical protein [Azospirillum sp. TSO22-1]|uniref:hypothetical protein n=1 Tax=Azospirillum sp. TSO22-1 TaxID=716789 RepID=UPI001304E0E2|nr:hypothetical protein [Azospirillum sp. TSO22-1]